MSTYLAALPASRRPAFGTAIGELAQIFADTCAEQARTVAAEGASAAALEAHYHGHPLSVEEIAAEIEALHGLRRQAA